MRSVIKIFFFPVLVLYGVISPKNGPVEIDGNSSSYRSTPSYILHAEQRVPHRALFKSVYDRKEARFYNILMFRSGDWQYIDEDRIYLNADGLFENYRLQYVMNHSKILSGNVWESYIFVLSADQMRYLAEAEKVRFKIGEDYYRLPDRAKKGVKHIRTGWSD